MPRSTDNPLGRLRRVSGGGGVWDSGAMASGKPGPSTAASRPFGERSELSFFCPSCKRAHRGLWVPEGWYVVERAAGGGARHLRLGLYCSLPFLGQAAAGHLAEGAAARAGNPDGGQAEPPRDKVRVVE